MARRLDTERCFRCGRTTVRGSDTCHTCGWPLLQLCSCGVGVWFADAVCPGCGATVRPRGRRGSRRRARRITNSVVAAGIVLTTFGAVWVRMGPQPEEVQPRCELPADAGSGAIAALPPATVAGAAPRPDANAWLLRGLREQDAGMDTQVVLTSLRRAVALDPDSTEASRALAAALLRAREYAEAVRVTEFALRLQPRDATLRHLHDEAVRHLRPSR